MLSESLCREIQQAHQQLFGNNPFDKRLRKASNLDNADVEKDSTKVSDTTPSRETVGIVRTVSSQRVIKIHDSSQPQFLQSFKDNEHWFENLKDGEADPRSTSTSSEIKLSFAFSNRTKTAKCDLAPSQWDDFALNHPSTFTDGSSTVPDNTIERQRMLEAAFTEPYHPPVPSLPIKDNPASTGSSSIPWSAYLATQNLKSQRNHKPSPAIVEPQECYVCQVPVTMRTQGVIMALEPSHTPLGSPQEAILAKLDDVQRVMSPKAVPEGYPSSEGAVSSKPRKKRKREELESDCLDELAIGLPKEQYKPRPSRSRSAQVASETIDYSAAPERTSRRKLKRTKTTDSPDGTADSSSSKKVNAIEDMGITPNRAQHAPTHSGGGLGEAIDNLSKRSSQKNQSRVQSGSGEVQTLTGEVIHCQLGTNEAVKVHADTSWPSSDVTACRGRQGRSDLVSVEIPVARSGSMPHHEANYSTDEASTTVNRKLVEENSTKAMTHKALSYLEGKPYGNSALNESSLRLSKSADNMPNELVDTMKLANDVAGVGSGDEVTSKAFKRKISGLGKGVELERLIPEGVEYPEVDTLVSRDKITTQETRETSLQCHLREASPNTEHRDTRKGSAGGVGRQSEDKDGKDDNLQPAAPPNEEHELTQSAGQQSQKALREKVPYRVGLSRRARITPLLKSVKK